MEFEEKYIKQDIEWAETYMLRQRRNSLLKAFDLWEKAVLRGREKDSEEIMNWYQDLLNLKESAFENIPERIKYYL